MANGNNGGDLQSAKTTRAYTFHAHLPYPYFTKQSGIYAIINRDNLKIYIGSAVRLDGRWREHRCSLAKGDHGNRYLQKAFNKNRDAFEMQVIEEIPNATKEVLLQQEQFWIDFYKSYLPNNGYNISPKAESCQGIKRDPEYRARLSLVRKGKKFSPERLAIHRNRKKPTKFRSFTPEQKAEQSRRFKGRKLSQEWRAKISKGLKGKPYPNGVKVCQYDLNGNFVAVHRTICDAAKALGISDHRIRQGIRHPTWRPGGFYWRRYTNNVASMQSISISKRHSPMPKPVIQFDAKMIPVGRFPSATAAAQELKMSTSHICACCHIPTWKARGYFWRYA